MRKEKEWTPRESAPRPKQIDNGADISDRIKVVSIAEWERIKKAQPLAAYEGWGVGKKAA